MTRINLIIHNYKGFENLKEVIEHIKDYDFVAEGYTTLVYDNEFFYAVGVQKKKSITLYWGRKDD